MILRSGIWMAVALLMLPSCAKIGSVGTLLFSDQKTSSLQLKVDPPVPVDSSTELLSWSTRSSGGVPAVNSGSVYDLEFSEGTSLTSPVVASAVVAPYRLTSLRAGSGYSFRITEKVNGGVVRTSEVIHFTTLPPVPRQPVLGQIVPSLHALSVGFTAGSNAATHTVFYGTDPALSNPASLVVSSNPAVLSGLLSGTDYYFYLRAENASGHSDTAIVQSRTLDETPVAPASIRVVSALDTLSLSWDPGTGTITGYRAALNTISNFSTTANPAPVVSGSITPALRTYSFGGLSPGKEFFIQVSAINSSTSAGSAIQSAWTLPPTPVLSAPTLVTANGATISWPTVQGASSEQVMVTLASTGAVVSTLNHTPGAGATQSIVLSGLAPDTGYSVLVSSINPGGASVSSPVSFRTILPAPLPPINLQTSNLSQASALVSWSPAASGGAPASYLVAYGLSSGAMGAPVEVFAPSSTLSLSGLAAGSAYSFTVTAKNSAGTSSVATGSFATPTMSTQNAPTALAAGSITANGAVLSWTAPQGTAPASFSVKWGTTPDLSAATATPLAAGVTTLNLGSALVPGTLYYFQVAAVFASGTPQSASSQFYTKPVAPTVGVVNPAVDSIQYGGFGGNGAATTYSISYGTTSALGSNGPSGASSTQSLSLTGLTSGTQIFYKVIASANGITAQAASASSVWTLPLAPVLTLSSKLDTGANLSWTVVPGAVRYRVLYSTNASMSGALVAGPVTTTTVSLAGLSPATSYYAQAYADNAGGGSSAASNTVSFVTNAQAPVAPVSVSVVVSGLVPTVSWKNGSGGGGVDSFSIETSNEASFQTQALITSSGPFVGMVPDASGVYSRVLSGLPAGGSYFARVIANNITASTPSTSIPFVTQPSSPDLSFGALQPATSPAGSYTSTLTLSGGAGASTMTLVYGLDPALSSNVTSIAANQGQVLSALYGSRTYYAKLVAANSSGSVSSPVRSFSTPLEAPAAPTGASAVVSNQSAVLSWSGGASVSQTSFEAGNLYTYFKANCAGCHQSASGSGYAFSQHASLDAFTAHKSMFANLSNGTPKLNVAVPESSGIYTVINGGHQGYGSTQASLILTYLKQWIAAGAGSGGITTSFSYKLGTTSTLSGVTAVGGTSPLSLSGLAASQTYFYQILSNNPGGSQTGGTIQSFTTASLQPSGAPTPIPAPAFEVELRVADRRYVDEVLRNVFGLAAVSSTNTGAALIVRQNIWERPEFGGACDRYAGIITGIANAATSLQPDVSNYPENCFNGMGVVNPAKLNQSRLALIAKTCDALVNDATAMGAVITKLYGSTTAGTVDAAHLTAAWQLFYPDETPSQTVQDKLAAVGAAFGTTPALQWKGIVLGICGSPGWQTGY